MSAPSDAPILSGTSWDEAKCRAALATLEAVQEQIDDLRLTIHRIVQPLSAPINDNPLLFQAYKQAIIGSQNNIKEFRTQWQCNDVQSVFEHTKESFGANPNLAAGAQVPRYGWRESETAEQEMVRGGKKRTQNSDERVISFGKEERARVVETFQKLHPQINLISKNDNQDLMIKFVAGSLKLRFHVVIDPAANGPDKLRAECLGTVKPYTTISRCISSRPHSNDLQDLLDMITAYKTIQGAFCARCSSLLDKTAQVPTARRKREITNDSGATDTIWEAIHESCLG